MRIARAILAFHLVALVAAPASADPAAAKPAPRPVPAHAARTGPALRWDEDRPRFRPVEYAITGAVGPVAFAEYFFQRPQPEPNWVGGILFDDAARDALRLRSPTAQRASWAMADGVGVSLVALSIGLDSIIVPLANGSLDVAVQLTLMDFESYALSSLMAITLYDTVGRARPSYEDCRRDPIHTQGCQTSPTASFPSGHINEAFTAAGLSCAHHAFMHLYGSTLADAFACGRDLTLATTEAMLRVMGDRHYMTDVIVGAAMGFSFGFGLPTLLHYVKWGHHAPITGLTVAPMLGPQTGIVAGGSF